ncbi:uncharacterized protein [Primulina eburnea]|uniref:uncharacterized protein n=1 Tax=Primulina eburnea TaxID=1245227 RepID=UPI003C6CB672
MAAAEEVRFSLKVITLKESFKVLYAQVDSDFADVLLSFLTLPLGTIVRLLVKHYGSNAPILGSLNSLYAGLQDLDSSHFWTEAGKLMLLNPRNSSGIQCSRLKLQIDDIPPIQCFECCNGTCVSMYNKVKCPCPNSTRTMIRRDLEIEPKMETGFVSAPTASFLLTDDLQILANSPTSIFRILKLNGIEHTNVLEERTLTVGLKEIMELLKGSLVSKTPLTDIILCLSTEAVPSNERKRLSASAIYETDALCLTLNSQNVRPDSKKIYIKAFVQKSTNRILLAETRQDLVDFLFSFLTIPLGRVQFLLGGNTFVGSISNLYRSISNLEIGEHMKSREATFRLLQPQLPLYCMSSYQIFSLDQECSPEFYRLCNSNRVKLFVSTPIDNCRKLKMIDPKGQDCFVKGPTTFMVTDDLVVSTPSSTSIISILNKMKIPLSDVEERELDIGMEEALSILKASLTSTGALTDGLKPFLTRQPKQKK